ncbi:MAG TPA: hypothetical protein VNG71_06685 [Pyrinomonadaceae bacterium]|nr:hypothetical protein [Pyrinomonadaceae bacterium]
MTDPASEIARKLDVLSGRFKDRFGFDLWSASPVTEISEIRRPVNNEDDLRLRTNSLVAIFEVLNKSEFDRKSGVKENYTRDSLVSLLKHEFPNDQPLIQDHIQMALAAIAHLRNHFSHRHRPMSARDLKYIGVHDVLANPSDTWNRVQHRLLQLLDKTLELLNQNSVSCINGAELSAKPLRVLVQDTYKRYQELLEDPVIASMLREIMHEGELLDTDLAMRFNRPVTEIRKLLFPLLDRVVRVRPNDSSSTKLHINGPMGAALENPDEWLKDEVR